MAEQIIVEEVIADLERMQKFDSSLLVRREELGNNAFLEVVEPANNLITLFNRLPKEIVRELPVQQKSDIQQSSKSAYNLFEQVLKFDLDQGNNAQRKDALVQSIDDAYQDYFNYLSPLISYSVARTVDFNRLAADGRAAVQSILDQTEPLLKEIREASEAAKTLLSEVREAAAEQGVTQMAKYFMEEAATHARASNLWLISCGVSAATVIGYSISTLFWRHWFVPENALESAQLIGSKLLIFGVLLYVLVQCVRSYSAHRHNFVTNKHRQNALLTYKTLAEAGNTPELRDAVLQHAAAAIYAPNDSGYLKGEERGYGAQGLLALVPRMTGGQPTPGS